MILSAMKRQRNIYLSIVVVLVSLLAVACNPEKEDSNGVKLSCGATLALTEGAVEVVTVSGAATYDITTSNSYVQCDKSGNTITLKALKVGECRLTVTGDDGTTATCVITITKSAAQKDFEIHSTPRVENWLDQPVNTETTPGLQVTYEYGIDAAGLPVEGVATFGFYFTETNTYCRVSARGDFMKRGTLDDGVVAMGTHGEPAQYYLCEKLEVVNVLNDKAWIVASMEGRADLRIVTEVF